MMTRVLYYSRDEQTNLARVLAIHMPLSILRDFSHARAAALLDEENATAISSSIRFDRQTRRRNLALSVFFSLSKKTRAWYAATRGRSDKADVVLLYLAYTSRRNTPRDFDVVRSRRNRARKRSLTRTRFFVLCGGLSERADSTFLRSRNSRRVTFLRRSLRSVRCRESRDYPPGSGRWSEGSPDAQHTRD